MEMIRLGLCCINTRLREKGIFCSRTTPRSHYTVKKAKELALQNIADIIKMVEWNSEKGIQCLRLSSDIFPHYTDPEVEPYTLEFAEAALREAGEAARRCQQRVVMHPGQFNQVGAKDPEVFEKTCRELEMHAWILDTMGIDQDGVLCVHGGGLYGDREATTERWIRQFSELPPCVQKRLAIENCERCYSVEDCLTISHACNIPLIFDNHHFECFRLIYPSHPISSTTAHEWIPKVLETWKRRGIRPLFHISEQRKAARIGAHSDLIETLPDYYEEIPRKYNVEIDIEVEAKWKEQAIFHLYDRYPDVFGWMIVSPL